jgi:uncharacterized protein (DUF433 family)
MAMWTLGLIILGNVLDMLASGMTGMDIIEEYPCLEEDDLPAVYARVSHLCKSGIAR